MTLPTRLHFMAATECFSSLIQAASGHTTALFLSEKTAHELKLLPVIEVMKAQGKVSWIKDIPESVITFNDESTQQAASLADHDLFIAIGSFAVLDYAKRCSSNHEPPIKIAVLTGIDALSVLSTRIAVQDHDTIALVDAKAYDHAYFVTETLRRLPLSDLLSDSLKALALASDAYWSKSSTKVTQVWSLQAIRMLVKNLPISLKNPDVYQARQQLLYGSLMSAMAVSNTLPGALSAVSTSLFYQVHLDQGLGSALILPDLLRINLSVLANPEGLYDAFNINNPEDLRNWLETVSVSLGSMKLTDHGLSETDLHKLVTQSMLLGIIDNNPLPLTPAQLKSILKLHL